MSKLFPLCALAILTIGAGCSKKEKSQSNIVSYKLDGLSREITGSYSDITLYGIEYEFKNDKCPSLSPK